MKSLFTEHREDISELIPEARQEEIEWMETQLLEMKDWNLPEDMTIGDAFEHIVREILKSKSIHKSMLESEKNGLE